MRKRISLFLTLILLFSSCAPITTLAADDNENNEYFTQEEIEQFEHVHAVYIETRASGLITGKSLTIAKNGTKLLISGYTRGTSEVNKCGFTEVIIQRKKASESKWSNYKTYDDLYSDSNYYSLSKSLTVTSGYQYRVTATHYAKKSLFSTQKIEVTTGYLTF